jgi:hypothetical protein
MVDRVRLSIGSGPLGTGAFLLGRHAVGSDVLEARVWLTLLFLPLVPLRAARLEGPIDIAAGETSEVAFAPRERSRGDVWGTYARALGLVLLTLAPLAYAWRTIHQTGLLQALKVVVGTGIPILVLMWRDLRTPRVGR